MGQVLVNTLISGAIIAPPAIGFSLLYGVLRFPNFAVGAFITVGAFAALLFNGVLGWSLMPSAAASMALTALAMWASDLVVFRPMRRFPPVALLIVSIALSFIVENVIRLIAGSDVRGYNLPLARPLVWAGIHVTSGQLLIVMTALAVMLATHVLLCYTALGKAMRATADNFALAEVRGIHTSRVITATWLLVGALIGLSGIFAGIDLVIEPLLGWNLIIPVFAAAILGGLGSPYGAMLGALLVGLAEELTVLVLPTTYKVGVGFVIIALLLLLRPHGLFGQPEIKR